MSDAQSGDRCTRSGRHGIAWRVALTSASLRGRWAAAARATKILAVIRERLFQEDAIRQFVEEYVERMQRLAPSFETEIAAHTQKVAEAASALASLTRAGVQAPRLDPDEISALTEPDCGIWATASAPTCRKPG